MTQVNGPDDQVHVLSDGEDLTVYPVIAAPPLLIGADHVTVTLPTPATPVTPLGEPGPVAARRVKVAGALNPSEFRALTRTLYDFVDASPGIVIDVAAQSVCGTAVQLTPSSEYSTL